MISREFLRLTSASREDMLTDAAVHVLSEKGAPGLTHRAVAEWLGVSPPRVSQMVSRDQLAFVALGRFGQRWCEWVEGRRWRDGALALLPDQPDELPGVRVWLALSELARAREDLAELMGIFRQREREAMASLEGVPADEERLQILMATAEGLRASLPASADLAMLATARSTLANLLVRLDVTSARRPRSASA